MLTMILLYSMNLQCLEVDTHHHKQAIYQHVSVRNLFIPSLSLVLICVASGFIASNMGAEMSMCQYLILDLKCSIDLSQT